MYLLRISVSKDARIDRSTAHGALSGLLGATETDEIFPRERGVTDAARAGAGYALLPWRRFLHNGAQCMAIAKSTKGTKKHGLHLHIHVQRCDEDTVEYSSLVARLMSSHASKAPVTIRENGASQFPELYAALDAEQLVSEGQAYLYDNDIRKILDRVLEPFAFSVWPGVSLVLQDDGVTLARNLERVLSKGLCNGSLSVSLVALEMSQANREALARELAQELTGQLEKLTERCGYTAPNKPAINKDYEALAAKIAQAEELLGVELPLLDTQIDTENALMAMV